MTGGDEGGQDGRWLPMLLCLLGLALWGARNARRRRSPRPRPYLRHRPLPRALTAREAALEERLRQMEERFRRMPDPEEVRRLQERLRSLPDPEHVHRLELTVRELSTQVDDLSARLREAEAAARQPADFNGTRAGPGRSTDAVGDDGIPPGGGAAPSGPAAEPDTARFDMPAPLPNIPATTRFGPGFQIRTPDDEFDIQFHDLTQLDGRFFSNPGEGLASDTFGIARQWFIFNGHLTRPYEYYASFTTAAQSFSVLDIFFNVNYDRRLQFRFGRFKTPFTYEFYAEPVQGLPNGEWSLFFNNFGINRSVGTMVGASRWPAGWTTPRGSSTARPTARSTRAARRV